MKTEYLREFAVFSRYLSFTDAAKELFIAQSTLSTHIAALESDVGFSAHRPESWQPTHRQRGRFSRRSPNTAGWTRRDAGTVPRDGRS